MNFSKSVKIDNIDSAIGGGVGGIYEYLSYPLSVLLAINGYQYTIILLAINVLLGTNVLLRSR